MKQLRSIFVGVGGRGRWPLEEATPERGFTPVALVDPNADNLTEAKKLMGELPAFAELGPALEQVEADAVIICSPTIYHVPLAKEALAAGQHVLVEKGMAPDLTSARDLVATVEASGLACSVAQNYRYHAMERTIGRLLHDENDPHYLGQPFLIEYVQHRVRPVPRTLTYPFASLWDMSCHHFDTLHYWLGAGFADVAGCAYAAPWSAYEHPNNTSFHLRHQSGCQVVYTHTHDAAASDLRIRVHGERGACFVDGSDVRFSPRPEANFGANQWQEVPLAPEPGLVGVLADFHAQVCEGKEPGISARNNLAVMELCDRAQRACEI